MSWLGNGFREEAQSLADAYASMYEGKDAMKNAPSIKDAKVPTKTNVKNYPGLGIAPTIKKEEAEQLDEISKGLATKAYAERRTNEFEGDELHTKSDKTRERIVKKHGEKAGKDADKAANKKIFGEEFEIVDEYCVSVEDGIALEEGKKKCKEGYKWDSEKGKCVKKKKKKSSSSNKTTIIVTGRGGYYGGSHGHGGSNDDNDGDKETDSNGGDGGGDGGGGE